MQCIMHRLRKTLRSIDCILSADAILLPEEIEPKRSPHRWSYEQRISRHKIKEHRVRDRSFRVQAVGTA